MKKLLVTAAVLFTIVGSAQAADRIPKQFVGSWCATDAETFRRATRAETKAHACVGDSGGLLVLDVDGMSVPENMDVAGLACVKRDDCVVTLLHWNKPVKFRLVLDRGRLLRFETSD